MNTKHLGNASIFAVAGLFVISLILSACGTALVTPAPIPTLSLDETSAREFVIDEFDAVHAPLDGDANEYLIFGNLTI